MTAQRSYECFDVHGKGHFHSVDDLFERGVWIGYLAESSRDVQYRQMPSFHDLEINQKNMNLPCPPIISGTACTDREAACRGCVGEDSNLLQLHEIRFGSNNKVVVMPLRGPGDVDLFCIMLPQPQDRSIKALETFRPYEHSTDREEFRPFVNNYMLLAIRDRKNHNGLIHMVCNTLSRLELAKIADCASTSRSSLGSDDKPVAKPATENDRRSGGQPRTEWKQKDTNGEDSGPNSSVKRKRPRSLQGSRKSKRTVSRSEENMEALIAPPHAYNSTLEAGVQQQRTASPRDTPHVPLSQTSRDPIANIESLGLTDEQARRIHFVWKIDFEGTEIEVRRTLGVTSSFRGLLGSFQKEAFLVPSAAGQIEADLWIMKYKLANGKSKAVFVNSSSPDLEHSFDSILRSLAEQEEWKQDKSVIVEVGLRALTSGGME